MVIIENKIDFQKKCYNKFSSYRIVDKYKKEILKIKSKENIFVVILPIPFVLVCE